MMKALQVLAAALFAFCLPCAGFAQSISDDVDASIASLNTLDSSLEADMSMFLGDYNMDFAKGLNEYGRPPQQGHPPVNGHAPAAGHRPPPPAHSYGHRPGHRPPPPARRETVYYYDDDDDFSVDTVGVVQHYNPDGEARYGAGLRFIGAAAESYTYDSWGGGFGYYFKARPIRWLSIEFVNDFIFAPGEGEDVFGDSNIDTRIPMMLDLQFHVFDYGDFDLYLLGGGAITFSINQTGFMESDDSIHGGATAGAGMSFLFGAFELGLDVRYLYERYISGCENDENDESHSVIFGVSIGFAIRS